MATQSYFTVRMNGVNMFYQTGTITQGATQSGTTLNTSIFGVWNGDIPATVTTLNTSLTSAWNGNSNTTDIIGSNTGTGSNLTYATGKFGNAFSFNGSSTIITLPVDGFKPTGSFSINTWINLTATGAIRTIMSDCSNTSNGFRLYVSSNNKVYLEYNTSFMASVTALAANTWYNIAVTYDGTTYKIYINGELESSQNGSALTWGANGTNNFYIGRYATATYFFYGLIDGTSIWNKALSLNEVIALYNSGTGYEATYPSSVSILTPSSNDGYGSNHGTLTNGTTFTTGKIGKAFTFDGVNDYVALPNNSINITGDFSISGWVYIPSGYMGGNQIYILDNISANTWFNNPNGYALSTYGNSILFDLCNNTNTNLTLTYNYGPGFPTNTWYHIVATRKSGVGSKIYLNGSLVASDSNTVNHTHLATVSKPCIGALDIPARGSVGYFATANSRIDAVSLWNKELSSTEVTDLYNSGTGKQYPYS